MLLEYLLVICAYFLGSLSGSLLMGRFRGVDIRTLGSGNAGGTNALRTQGIWFALPVVVIDIAKGVFACALPIMIASAGLASPLVLACALAAVVGHCYPIWHGFRGGKGAGTALGTLLVIQPYVILPCILVWVITLILTGWVGLATINAFLGLVLVFIYHQAGENLIVFSALLAILILFMHRANIKRIFSGEENRFDKVYWRNWFRK